jgi:hypothetical protein
VSWLQRLSDLHVKCATLFERLAILSNSVEGLAEDIKDVSLRVGRVEGAVVNAPTSEVLRQVADLQERISKMELLLLSLSTQQLDASIAPKQLPLKASKGRVTPPRRIIE